MENTKKIICSNCGADIEKKEPVCPFCGYINIIGAEEKYMRDVNQTKEDMSQIPELQKEELKKSVSKKGRIVVFTVAIAGGIALLMAVLSMAHHAWENSQDTYDAKAEMQWERENYPLLDERYEAGDYEYIHTFAQELYRDNKENKTHHSLYNWDHFDFYSAYANYAGARYLIESLDAGNYVSKYDITNFVYSALWFYKGEYNNGYENYTDAEIEILEEYRTELLGYFTDRFGYTQTELDQLYEQVTEEGFLDMIACDDYVKENMERFR